MTSWKALSREQRRQILKPIAERGMTSFEMVTALNEAGYGPVTRSAVIAQCARLGILVGRVNNGYVAKQAAKPTPAKARPQPPASPRKKLFPAQILVPPDPAKQIGFVDYVRGKHCNYPMWPNDADIAKVGLMVCGAEPKAGRDLCDYHHHRCHQSERE